MMVDIFGVVMLLLGTVIGVFLNKLGSKIGSFSKRRR